MSRRSDFLEGIFRNNQNRNGVIAPPIPRRKRGMELEQLESRVLLSSDLMVFLADAAHSDLTVRIDGNLAQIVDSGTGSVLISQALENTSGITVTGSEGDDCLRVDSTAVTSSLAICFEGGLGADSLFGPATNNAWSITGDGAGSVGNVTFASLERLIGAADNQDVFIFEQNGRIAKTLEGGAAGFDSIQLEGAFEQMTFTITGADSGIIERDSDVLTYAGFEPIINNAALPTTVTVVGTAGADKIRIADRGTGSDSDFVVSFVIGEDQIFTNAATTGLIVNAGAGNDEISIEFPDSGLISIEINAEGGNDEISLPFMSSLVAYDFDGGTETDTLRVRTSELTLTDTSLSNGIGTTVLASFERAFMIVDGPLDATGFSGQVFSIEDIPEWVEEGPNPFSQILDGATAPWDPVSGAINSIAVDPNDRFTIYLGTANGGVWRNTGSTQVLFGVVGDATLDAGDQAILNAFADFLEAHPTLTVEIGGHADSQGTPANNLTLSQTRATNVKNYLVNTRLIEASRLTTVGYGEDRPVADNGGEDGDQPLNRRVELLVQNWEPMTDDMPSMSISSIAVSPLSSNVIYAGIGRTSSFASVGGFETGLLVSIDRGENWRVLGTDRLRGLTVTKVLPTTLTSGGEQIVFVSTFDVDRNNDGNLDDEGGVFRIVVAADGTATSIEKLSGAGDVAGTNLPTGHYTDLVFDSVSNNVYAANPGVGQGIFRASDGSGDVWTAENTGFQFGTDTDLDTNDDLLQSATRIKFGIHAATGSLWAGVLGPVDGNGIFNLTAGTGVGLIGLFFTADAAENWANIVVPTSLDGAGPAATTFGLHPGGQGDTHFSIVVDPTDAHVVYVGGDAQGTTTNNSVGLTNAGSGRLFALTSFLVPTWTQIVGTGAATTAPHADSRGMVFTSNFTLLEIDDGGLSRLQNPFGDLGQGTRQWTSANGNLRISEVLRLAYDSLNDDIIVGLQDNGSSHQDAGNTDGINNDHDGADGNGDGIVAFNEGTIDEADEDAFWSGTGGDGNSQATIPIDMTGDAVPDRVLRYSLHNNFNFLQVYEYTTVGVLVNAVGVPTNTFQTIGLRTPGNATNFSALNAQDAALGFDVIPMVVNTNDPTRMLIAYNGIYESVNTNINPGVGGTRILPLDEVQQIDPAAGVAVAAGQEVTALIYGGTTGGVANNELIIASRGNNIQVRQTAGGAFTSRVVTGAGPIRDIAVDPDNWKVVYVADATDVYRISDVTNAGALWVKITGNLQSIGQSGLRSLEYVEAGTGDMLLVGGIGGVSRLRNPDAAPGVDQWIRLGSHLPNVPVFDIEWVDDDNDGVLSAPDRLLAGTLGRGVLSLTATQITSFAQNSVLKIFGKDAASPAGDDNLLFVRDVENPLLFNVFDLDESSTEPIFTGRGSSFDQIIIDMRGGDDDVTVDHSNGGVYVPRGIAIDGGSGGETNTVILTGGAFTSHTTTPPPPTLIHDIVDLDNRRQRVLVEDATVNDAALPDPLDFVFDTLKGAFNTLVDFLTLSEELSENVPLFASSLGRALNGIPVEEPAPLLSPDGEEEDHGSVSQSERVVGASGETVDLLRRFIETGTGAFNIDDIANFTTIAQLVAALEGLDESAGGAGTVTSTGDLTAGFEITLTGITKNLEGRADVDLDLMGGAIHIKGLVDVSADVTLNLTFGVNNTLGFYIKEGVGHEIVISHIVVPNAEDIKATGRFGFLGVEMTEADLSMDSDVRFDIDIEESGGDGNILLTDLISTPSAYISANLNGDPSNVDVTLVGTFAVSALIPGVDAPFDLFDARATITWDDIDAADLNGPSNVHIDPTVGSTSAGALLSFLEFGTQEFLDQLTTLKNQIDAIFGDTEIPFLSDGLTDLVGYVTAFQQQVLDPISDGLSGFGIPTIQSLVTTLANQLGIALDELGLSYNSATTELTFHLVVDKTIVNQTKSLGAGVDIAGGLADVQFSTTATVGATVTLDTIFGLDIQELLDGGSPLDWFFLKDPSLSLNASIEAEDVEAKARFGFLSIGIDEGELTAPDLSLTVSLNDPGANAADGRIDLSELDDGIADLGDFLSITGGGSLELTLPVETSFLPGLGDIADGTPIDPTLLPRSIIINVPDLSNPSVLTVVLGSALTHLGNFRNIDAASLVSLLGQLTFWLDEFRRSDEFANFDIPIIGPALDQVLGFADEFRDRVLLDDLDTGLDDDKTLLNDINAALDDAGLGRLIYARRVGNNIAFFGLDASVTTFTVAGATALGFDPSQGGSITPGEFFAKAIASGVFSDAEGNLLADLNFTITIGTKVYEVEIEAANTTANTSVGDDRWKLVNGQNAATFATAQEMAIRLLDAFGVGYPGLAYNTGDQTLTFTVDMSGVFGQVDLPFNFSLDELDDFLQLQTSGKVRLKASGALNLELGVFLGPAQPSDELTDATLLSDLTEPVVISTEPRIVAPNPVRTVYGQLSDDAHFTLGIVGDPAITNPIAVTVTKVNAANNVTASDLVTDINNALTAVALNGKILAVADGLRIELVKVTGATLTDFTLTTTNTDPAVKDIGFGAVQDADVDPDDSKLKISATKDLVALRGRLTGNASFTLSLNNVNGGSPLLINVLAANTETNRFAFDIINDINASFSGHPEWLYDDPETVETTLVPRVEIGLSDGRLTFAGKAGATALTLGSLTGTAATELGLGAATGNSDDLFITLRNGTTHRVNLDGSTNIGHIISKIELATGGLVDVTINERGSGLTLEDTTGGGTEFKVQILNNSTAGLSLGIVREDAGEGETPDGFIEGADIAALTPLDRFFIKATPVGQDPLAGLSVSIGTPLPLTASAKFGFVGLDLEGHGALGLPDNNALQASLTLRLIEPGGGDGRVSLAELIDSLDDIGSLFDISLTGTAAFDLTISAPQIAALAADLGIDLAAGAKVQFTANLGDVFADVPVAPTFDFTYPNFGELLDFGNVEFNFQSIIAGLRLLNDFLSQFEAFDFLDDPLPVVGVSVSEMISVADKFADAVDGARNNPAGTLQVLEGKLKQAFGLPPSSTLINLVLVNDDNGTGSTADDFRILRFDLNVGAAFSETVGFDFDLGPDVPIDLGGGGDLTAAGSIDLSLSIGFDIEDPTRMFLFDSTGLAGTLDLTGNDLSLRAAVGPLGVFIDGGSVDIGGTLLPGNKLFRANFDDLTFVNNRVLIDFEDLGALLDGFSADLAGAISVELPVYFPTESIFAGTVLFDASLSLLGGEFDTTFDPRAEDENGDPIPLASLFDFDPGELSLLDQLLLGVDGADLFLEGLQDILDGEIGGVKLPLLGDKLAGAADVIGDLRSGFVEDFRKAIEDMANPAAEFAASAGEGAGLLAVPTDPMSKILFQLLGEPGLDLLLDTNASGTSDIGDITFKSNFDDPDTEPGDLFFDWDFKLGQSLDKSAGIDFDIGIPGLGLETTGAVAFTLGWELELGFGLNFDDGFYFDIGDDADEAGDDNTELELFVEVSIPGGGIKGTLGFLQLEAEDDTDDSDGLTTHLSATFGINIFNKTLASDTKLGFSELGRISIDAGIAAEAVVDLGMKLSLSSDLVPSADTNFPSVVADFTLIWQVGDADAGDLISLSDLDGNFLKNGLQYVAFEHVGLDLGSYLSDLIGPIANTIQEITEPIKPFLDFLTEPIPVISQLAGPTSLLDIAAMSGLINPGIIAAIEVIDQVVDIANLVNSLPSGNVIMYFDAFLPSLVIYGTPPGSTSILAGSGIDLTNPNLDLKSLSETLLAGLDFLPAELQAALGGVVSDLAAGVSKMLPNGSASSGFSLPIIEDPSQIFGMLMGQPAVLVQYDMAPLEIEAEFSAFFSIFGPLGVSINAEFAAQFGPFTFGYDTLGITQFADSDFKNPLLLFDGFFVGDLDAEGNDVPELQFDAGLWAAAELNLGIARGGVGGGLFAEIDFDLHDPNDDGRVRIKEIVTNFLNQARFTDEPLLAPLAIFDITGKLEARLFAFLKIDFGFFEVDEEFQITDPITLLDFESDFQRFPTLATELPDGVLQLNMGKFSDQRIEGDLSDLPEVFHVKQDGAGHVKVWAPSLGVAEGQAQGYAVSSLILALGGEGDDIIDLHLVTDNLKYELEGNAGDDVIKVGTTGTGAAHILGGQGDDELWGGGGGDTIFGETGDDEIHGGGGIDWLFGDSDAEDSILGTTIAVTAKANDGNDEIHGDAGDDLIFGAGGQDELHGGADNDVLIGDAGTVTVGGDRRVVTLRSTLTPPQPADPDRLELAVFDTSKTGKGAKDELYGEAGNDRLYGGVGDDLLEGGTENDVIWGELGPDTINAGDGNDVVFGDFGTFSLFNGALEPEATVGGENDIIHGDGGNDRLLGGAGKDEIHGDAGADTLLGGTGQDKMYGEAGADFLYGNADADEMYGGADGDFLEGGGGNDFVRGEANNDLLVAGYGSDDLDGGEGSDTYRITARGGSITDSSIAFDSGLTPTDTDILIFIGTDDPDTVLLRAMADFYFPTLVKLIGDGSSKGLTDKIFESGEPDKLRAILQALEDSYGPHDIPAGLISQIIDLYVADVDNHVENAISNEYVVDPDPESTVPSLSDLLALVNHVDDPLDDEDHDGIFLTDSRSKLQEIQDAITKAYGRNAVPSTMFTEITNAWNNVSGGLKGSIESAIGAKYQSEALVGLHKIVQEESDSSQSDPDKLDAMIARITAAYAPGSPPAAMLTALTTAFTADPDDVDALKAAITAHYNPAVPVPGIETDTGFVALLNNGGANVERFNYRYMEGLVINTIGDDDYVVSDDVIGTLTINLGIGDDKVQIGQVFRSERVKDPAGELITGITAEDVFTTLEITRGWLSNGVSRATTVNGGDGNDQFTVFHNVAVLNLNGGDGDDIFTVRAFALKGSTDSERARTDMKGDGGADTILYVVNAPVGIDGGDGFDTVRIVGTEFADDFVITDSGIFGAGLNVTYVNIEKLVADGAEGDDRYFVLSTGLEVVTEIDGGLGSDTYFVGGNPSRAPIPVISNDFKGHSGIILHSVESTLAGSAWTGLPVEGISVNVGDNEEDFFIVNESDGGTRVVEGSNNNLGGWEFDSYGIRLTTAPGSGQTVTINIVLAGMSPEDQAKGFRDLEFFAISSLDTLDGEPHGAPLGFNELTDLPNLPSLTFTTANWFIPKYVKFRAVDVANYSPDSIQLPDSPLEDEASEGKRFVFINHSAQNSTDPDYQSAQMLSVKVHMEDNDRDGVIVTPIGRDNVVLEGGFTDEYSVVLAQAPTSPVTVTMNVLGDPDQISLSSYVLLFDNDDDGNAADGTVWSTPQNITVTGVNDAVVEGFHTDYIEFVVTSADVDETLDVVNLQVDGDFDLLGVQPIPPAKPTSYVLLPNKPILGEPIDAPISVSVGGVARPASRYSISGNTLSFIGPTGTSELVTGNVIVSYSYHEEGYDGSFVKDSVVDIYDNDTPTVIVEQFGDSSTDVIEGFLFGKTDHYRIRLSQAPALGEIVTVVIDSVKTRTTYGRTALFETQVNVAGEGDVVDGDLTLSRITFNSGNWNVWKEVVVTAIDDSVFDGNDTQVFAPDLQTVNKIRGPLIVEGAAGAGSLSLPRPLMLPHELSVLKPDGVVQSFIPGTGGGAEETMTVLNDDLLLVIERLQDEDSNIEDIEDLIGKTVEMSSGPGTGVILDPLRPDDKFDRFWLIKDAVLLVDGDLDDSNDLVELTLQNPTLVDPSKPNVIAPDNTSKFAITSLSVNFFADEREQVDYLFVYDEDSVASDVGALTSSDGAVIAFNAGTQIITIDTAALQAVARLLNPDSTDFSGLLGLKLEITVGPALGRVWTIASISVADGPITGTKLVTLIPFSGSGTPTNRSEFRIEGSDRYGRIIGFGMGPNVLFGDKPQPGGITYGDIEVVQMTLGSGNDTVRVDYTTNSEDHTTKRSGDFYTLTTLDTGKGNDTITVTLTDGDDGAFALNLEAGNDTVNGGTSTLPMVIFGGDGNDTITSGSGADIIFGDIGRVDYIKTVPTDINDDQIPDTLVNQIITRLGHTVAQNPVNPPVTGATATTLSDANTTFDTAFGGLVGLSVQVISPEGHVQFRTIVANDAHTITIDRPWDQIPVFHNPLPDPVPDDNFFYRFSSRPDDQTDGVMRGPRVAWSINNSTGGNDTVNGGGGQDIVIGGIGDDTIHGDAGHDYLAGDIARFDFVPAVGNDGPTNFSVVQTTDRLIGGIDTIYGDADDDILIGGTNSDNLDGGSERDLIFGDNVLLTRNAGSGDAIDPRFRALTGAVIYGSDGLAQVAGQFAVGVNPVPGGRPAWGDLTITLDPSLVAAQFGNDYIAGGAGDDEIFGQLGNDTIQGDGSITSKFTPVDLTSTAAGTHRLQVLNASGAITSLKSFNGAAAGVSVAADTIIVTGHGLVGGEMVVYRNNGTANVGGLVNLGLYRVVVVDANTIRLVGVVDARRVVTDIMNAAAERLTGLLVMKASGEASSDGDDYIEGNGGNDVLFGNLGQDDIIGGNSSLFSLGSATLRPDGADLIFGGAGTDTARNDAGDASNGRDADMILGDNGNIYRLVTAAASYLNFNYDNAYAMQILPRAAELLDYTPGGPDYNAAAAATNIGSADEIHGESGDDFLYGMVGGDAMFGDGQNDVIVGGYGADWISGGTGDDGILGDDGRVFISRNSLSLDEPLYGIAVIPAGQLNALTSFQSGQTTAVTNVSGALKYTVDLTPFSVDPTNAAPSTLMPRALHANDMIFGGLGTDSLHGGAGEDAISGAEAMGTSYVNNYLQNGDKVAGAPIQSDFAHPVNPGNVLGYNPTTTKFAFYDANDPLRKIMLNATTGALAKTATGAVEWALNFVETEGPVDTFWIVGTSYTGVPTDGDDHVFGDLGHDWLVGGTGRDTLWGGWGDDLMQADDKLLIGNGFDEPDTNPSWEDFVYGGAGRDVLIGNTGGERMWDWTGEFNTFGVPYNPFGIPTVQRIFQPAMEGFLLALSRSQGADQTLAAQYGSSAARNGEPFGEIGMVLTSDAAWNDQIGSPRDPQSPLSNAKRDVNPSAGVQPIFETADAPASSPGAPALLTDAQLAAATVQAKAYWSQELGAGDSRLATLDSARIEVGNLPDLRLGATLGGWVLIDSDAAGYGWSLDSTATRSGQMDLLSVVKHEIGHLLGFDHDDEGLMSETLAVDQRKLERIATNSSTPSSLFEYAQVPTVGQSSLDGTRLIDWTRQLNNTGLGWGPIGKRENFAGFPEFSIRGSSDHENGKAVAGPQKKRRFDPNEDVAITNDLSSWDIEA